VRARAARGAGASEACARRRARAGCVRTSLLLRGARRLTCCPRATPSPLSCPLPGDLATIGDINAATTSSGDPSGAHDHSNTTGGGTPTALGASGGGGAGGGGAAATGAGLMPKSASFTALSALEQSAAAAAAAPAGGLAPMPDGPPGGVPVGAFSMGGLGSMVITGGPIPLEAVPLAGGAPGMPRVHSTPSLHGYPQGLQPLGDGGAFHGGMHGLGPGGLALQPLGGGGPPVKLEGTFWSAELPQPGLAPLGAPSMMGPSMVPNMGGMGGGMNRSRSCGNLALGGGGGMGSGGGGGELAPPHGMVPGQMLPPQQQHQHQPLSSEGSPLMQPFGGAPRSSGGGDPSLSGGGAPAGGSSDGGAPRPLLVRVGSEQHLIAPQPTHLGLKGMSRIASESHLGSMVPITPTSLLAGTGSISAGGAPLGAGMVPSPGSELGGGSGGGAALTQQQAQQQALQLQHQHLQQQQALYQHHQQQLGLLQHQQQQQQLAQRQGIMGMPRSHSVAVMGGLESIDEMQATMSFPALMGGPGVNLALGGGGAGGGPPPGGGGMVPLAPGGAHMLLGAGTGPLPLPVPGGMAMPLGGLHGGYSHAGAGAALPAAPPPLPPRGSGSGGGAQPTGSGGGAAAAPGSSAAAAAQLAASGDLGLCGPGDAAMKAEAAWEGLGEHDQPGSPFGINGGVHIGGEELDMTLAFLNDGPGGDMGHDGHGGAVRMDETAG
jgi:hypothetical protein